jgi:hypothetical protein
VAEGGLKPESTLAYSTVVEAVKKVATTLQISDELPEDAPAVSSFINSRLSLLQIEPERQLFRGTAGGNEVQGLTDVARRAGLCRRHRGRQQGGADVQKR